MRLLRSIGMGEGCSGRGPKSRRPPSSFEFLSADPFAGHGSVSHFPLVTIDPHGGRRRIRCMCRDGLGDVFSRSAPWGKNDSVWMDGSFLMHALIFFGRTTGLNFLRVIDWVVALMDVF